MCNAVPLAGTQMRYEQSLRDMRACLVQNFNRLNATEFISGLLRAKAPRKHPSDPECSGTLTAEEKPGTPAACCDKAGSHKGSEGKSLAAGLLYEGCKILAALGL